MSPDIRTVPSASFVRHCSRLKLTELREMKFRKKLKQRSSKGLRAPMLLSVRIGTSGLIALKVIKKFTTALCEIIKASDLWMP